MDNLLRRLRGTLGMALLWGVGWAAAFVAAIVVFVVLAAIGVIPGGFSWVEALGFVVRVGIVGAVAGVAFSPVISFLYHDRRLSDLSWVRFGLGGALVTGVAVPLFLQTMNLLGSGELVPWALVLDDGLFTAVIGGVAAGGSLKLAQVGDRAALTDGGPPLPDRIQGEGRAALEGEGETGQG